MRAAFVGWRDQQQLSDVRCKENLLKAEHDDPCLHHMSGELNHRRASQTRAGINEWARKRA